MRVVGKNSAQSEWGCSLLLMGNTSSVPCLRILATAAEKSSFFRGREVIDPLDHILGRFHYGCGTETPRWTAMDGPHDMERPAVHALARAREGPPKLDTRRS